MRRSLFLSFFILLSFGCSKEPILEFINHEIPSYMRESLPKDLNHTLAYLTNQGDTLYFVSEGEYSKYPTFNTNMDPVDFSEKFDWKMVLQPDKEIIKVNLSTVYSGSTRINFEVSIWQKPRDSAYDYSLVPLPKDSIYRSDRQKFHSTYYVHGKEYHNCYELIGGSRENFTAGKLIYNYSDGILYFEACGRETFTRLPKQ